MTTGDKIRAFRKGLKFSQEKLASLLNISYMTVRRWENGKSSPSSEMLQEIAKVLKTTPEELLPNKEEENDDVVITAEKQTTTTEDMARIELGNGRNFSAPATPEGYAFLEKLFLASLNAPAISSQVVMA